MQSCLNRKVPKRVAPFPPNAPPSAAPSAAPSSSELADDTIEAAIERNDAVAATRLLVGVTPADGLLHAAAEAGASNVIPVLRACPRGDTNNRPSVFHALTFFAARSHAIVRSRRRRQPLVLGRRRPDAAACCDCEWPRRFCRAAHRSSALRRDARRRQIQNGAHARTATHAFLFLSAHACSDDCPACAL